MSESTGRTEEESRGREKRAWDPMTLTVLGDVRDLVQTKGSPEGDGGGNPFKTLEQDARP